MPNELLTAALTVLAKFDPVWCALVILAAIALYRLPDLIRALRKQYLLRLH